MKWVRVTKWTLGIGLAAYVVAVAGLWATRPRVDGPIVEARVVRFGTNPSRWRPDWVTVVASTPDGLTGHDDLPAERLDELDCKVGDAVDARMVGSTLVVDARTCGKARTASQ